MQRRQRGAGDRPSSSNRQQRYMVAVKHKLTARRMYQNNTEDMMEAHKTTRAAGMAATYADILIKAGVIKPQVKEAAPILRLHEQIIRGEVNWWEVCLGQLPAAKK